MSRRKVARKQVVGCPRCGFEADPSAGALNFCPGCGASLRAGEGGASSALGGRVIAERYRLLELIGEGGMGAVYKAEHIRMGKVLALKILRGDFAREPGAVDRFLAEARIVSRLSHPHTIAVFDFGEVDEDGSGFYLAMEYVPGKDLAALLREAGRLPVRRVAGIGRQILGSLAEAHDAGIVHRDVKPGNVMLMQTRSDEDFVKVLDFGIAKLRHAGPDGGAAAAAPGSSSSLTIAGAIVGTPNYLAPEQARSGPIDGRSDLYAVGCLLYELAAGRPPFVAPSPMAVVAAHLNQEPPPLAQQAPEIGRGFAEVVHRALRKRPEERFASADEMRTALQALSEPPSATTGRRRARSSPREGELRFASRDDFARVERQVRALRGGRVVAPLLGLAAVLAMAVAVVSRWTDVYALAEARAPRLANAIPASLRPVPAARGGEREPNDSPAGANAVSFPPGPDGREAGGVAVIRGRLRAGAPGADGDVDVYRIEVPVASGTKVLVAEWHGETDGQGVPGTDAALLLNRALPAGDPRAPLVASAQRGGAGRPETLVAAVEPGTYYLSVRDRTGGAAPAPAEGASGAYALRVQLGDRRPGEELEPDDGPDPADVHRDRFAAWRRVAERNALEEGAPVRGETGTEDPDLYAVAPRAAGGAPELVVAVPDPGLALAARLWVPNAEDVLPSAAQRRVGLVEAGEAPAGGILVLRPGAPSEGAPVIVQLRAAVGEGSYRIAALGPGSVSAAAALALVRALAEDGRSAAALELAAAYAGTFPGGASRDVLLLAGAVAARTAASLPREAVATFDRAAELLGGAIFEEVDATVVYRGAFEARAAAPRGVIPREAGASTAR